MKRISSGESHLETPTQEPGKMQTVWLAPWMQFRCSNREKYKILTRDDFESRNYSKCFTRFRALWPSVSFSYSHPRLLLLLVPPSRRGGSCFKPFANELSIKFYHATEIKEEPSRSLNLYGRCPSGIFPQQSRQRLRARAP